MKLSDNVKIILCDDIRYEVGGKTSLMGIFPKEVVIKEPPFLFPKLSIALMFENMLERLETIDVIIHGPESEPVKINLPLPAEYKIGGDLNLFVNLTALKLVGVGEFKITVTLPDDGDVIGERIYQVITMPMNN